MPAQSAAPPLRSTFGIGVAHSVTAHSVQPQEPLAGSVSGVLVQVTHPIGVTGAWTWRYLAEATPLMLVRLGANAERREQIGPGLRPLFDVRRSVAVGVAPLGLQASRPLGGRLRAFVETTGGGAYFTRVVPYGDDATRNNFTFDARVWLERTGTARTAWGIGYGLHHISNGGFGRANPGINAHSLVIRWTRTSTSH